MYSGKIAVPPGGGGLRILLTYFIALSIRMRDFVPQSQFSSCKSEISVYKYSHNFLKKIRCEFTFKNTFRNLCLSHQYCEHFISFLQKRYQKFRRVF
jgi:hypothetical protein